MAISTVHMQHARTSTGGLLSHLLALALPRYSSPLELELSVLYLFTGISASGSWTTRQVPGTPVWSFVVYESFDVKGVGAQPSGSIFKQ